MKYCILVIVLLLCSCSDVDHSGGIASFRIGGNEKYLLKEINAGMLCEYFPVLLESKELQDLSPDDNPIII